MLYGNIKLYSLLHILILSEKECIYIWIYGWMCMYMHMFISYHNFKWTYFSIGIKIKDDLLPILLRRGF